MKFKTFAQKAGRYLFSGITTTGVVTAVGLVSVAGAAVISPALGLAVGAFVFGGLAEGEAFFQSISGGVKSLATLGKEGYRELILAQFHRNIKSLRNKQTTSAWLNYYTHLKALVEAFEKAKFTNKLNRVKIDEQALAQHELAKKRLALMQDWIVEQVLAKQQGREAQSEYSLGHDPDVKSAIAALSQKNWRTRQNIIRLGLPISLVSGTGFALLSSAFLPAALTALSISATMVWPLIIAAGIGGAFLIFYNIRDMVMSGFFEKWKNRFQKWFKPPVTGVNAKYVFKVVGLSLMIATITTMFVLSFLGSLGISWPAMKLGASMIPHLVKAAKWIRNVIAPVFFGSMAFFSVTNTANSVGKLSKGIPALIQWIKKPLFFNRIKTKIEVFFGKLHQRENIAQMLDPFRLVSEVILGLSVFLMFVGHTLAGGVGGDKFGKIPTAVLAVASASNEGLQDGPFFWKESKNTLTYWLFKVALAPLLILSAGYQTLVSQYNDDVSKNKLSFKSAIRKAFEWPEKVETMPAALPEHESANKKDLADHAWVCAEIKTRFQKRITRTENEAEKKQLMSAQNDLLRENNVVSQSPLLKVADHHAAVFSTKNTRFIDKMKQQYSPNLAPQQRA